MKWLIILPILIPFGTGILSLLVRRSAKGQRLLGIVGSIASLVIAFVILRDVWHNGIQSVQLGNWPAPFGITLVADLFSAIMIVLTAIIGLAVTLYSLDSIDGRRQSFGYFLLIGILLMGVCGSFLAGDIFNMYVWFEVMLIASFVLIALGGARHQMEGAIKYVRISLVPSAIFLAAVGVLYSKMGTLNMADLAYKLSSEPPSILITCSALLFLVAFGIKAAIFPLFFWLPASYHTPPVAVSAIFAGLLTKVGVYALIRFFTLLFVHNLDFIHTLILVLSALTMITGVLGAIAQNEFRRILSFHIVSQIGYMILGLGLFTPLALAGSVFYIGHHIIVKTNLFLVSGVAQRLRGTGELKKLGGLYQSYPFLAILFLIPALSLAGIPPLSGFFAKFSLIKAGLGGQHYAVVGTALIVGLLTLFSMTKIWNEAFWKAAPEREFTVSDRIRQLSKPHAVLLIPIVGLALITILIGVAAEPFFTLALRAAEQLSNPSEYIYAVLGKSL